MYEGAAPFGPGSHRTLYKALSNRRFVFVMLPAFVGAGTCFISLTCLAPNLERPMPTTRKHIEPVAGNGLLHRRIFLRGGIALAMTPYAYAQQLTDDPWSL